MGKSKYALSANDRELYRPFSVVRQLSPASATALEFFFTSAGSNALCSWLTDGSSRDTGTTSGPVCARRPARWARSTRRCPSRRCPLQCAPLRRPPRWMHPSLRRPPRWMHPSLRRPPRWMHASLRRPPRWMHPSLRCPPRWTHPPPRRPPRQTLSPRKPMCHPRVVPVERASRRTGTVLSDLYCIVFQLKGEELL